MTSYSREKPNLDNFMVLVNYREILKLDNFTPLSKYPFVILNTFSIYILFVMIVAMLIVFFINCMHVKIMVLLSYLYVLYNVPFSYLHCSDLV